MRVETVISILRTGVRVASRDVHREQTLQIGRSKLVAVDNGIQNQTGRSFAIAHRQHRMGIDQTGWFRTEPEFYDSCLQTTDDGLQTSRRSVPDGSFCNGVRNCAGFVVGSPENRPKRRVDGAPEE